MVPSARVVNHSGCGVDVGVVRGGLQRDVDGHLEPVAPGRADEDVEVVEGAEVGVEGVVAAVGGADGVRAAGVAVLGGEAVVLALARRRADGVHRGEVDDVEAHGGDGRQPLGRGAQRAGAPDAGLFVVAGALGAREDLVPRAEQRELALDEQGVCRAGADHLAERVAREPVVQVGGGRERGGGRGALGRCRAGRATAWCTRLRLALGQCRPEGPLEHPGALLEHQLGVDAGLDLDRRVVHPRGPGVGPALDPVGPPAGPVGDAPWRSTS